MSTATSKGTSIFVSLKTSAVRELVGQYFHRPSHQMILEDAIEAFAATKWEAWTATCRRLLSVYNDAFPLAIPQQTRSLKTYDLWGQLAAPQTFWAWSKDHTRPTDRYSRLACRDTICDLLGTVDDQDRDALRRLARIERDIQSAIGEVSDAQPRQRRIDDPAAEIAARLAERMGRLILDRLEASSERLPWRDVLRWLLRLAKIVLGRILGAAHHTYLDVGDTPTLGHTIERPVIRGPNRPQVLTIKSICGELAAA